MNRSTFVSAVARLNFFKASNLKYVLMLVVLLAGLSFVAHAQEATIVGTVTDPAGSVVPNVTITVTNVGTGNARVYTTNDSGQYVAASLVIGTYNVKAEATGFKVEESKGLVLSVNDRTRVDFQMKVGTKSEVISVEANAIAVQADNGEASSLVNGRQITELATNGRTIYSYVTLTPGASNLNPDSQLPVPTGGASGNISFNGNRAGHNLYLLDGGENADRGGAGSSSVLPSIDAIAETQTLTSNYSAEYGLSSGGTISSVVRSGQQTLHASAWEFFRNDALDARYFFNTKPNPVGELRYNIYGFNIGGPVTLGKLYNPNKTKTFFFYNMEWRKIINGGSPINRQVPLPATYGGDFSSVAPTLAQLHAPFSCEVSAPIQAQFAAAGQALSGCTGGVRDTTLEVPFKLNKIAPSLLNSYGQSLLTAGGKYGGIFPAPTQGNKFVLPVSTPTNVREEIVRMDHNFTDKFSVYGHFVAEQISQNIATTMWSGDNVPSIGNTFGNPSYAGVVHTTYTISPTLINEASFNYNGNRINILPLGLFTSPGAFGRFFTGPNALNRIPSINLGGDTGANYTANWTPWVNVADDYQIRDDISWTKGRHQLKFGGSWALYKKTQDWFKNTEGNYTFNGSFTGNDFADYLLGYAQNYTEDAVKRAGQWNNVSWALYLQDNFRATNRLTLNLGLRWDGIPHTYEASNNMANFYPELYDPAKPATLNPDGNTIANNSLGLGPSPDPILAGLQFYTNGIAICGKGAPKGCVNDSWKNFGPRLGFAYDLFGNGKTVVRGGYGIMYERVQGNDVYNNAGTVPLAASINFSNVILANPGTGVGGGNSVGIPVNNITGLDKSNYRSPMSSQFSLGVQQAIGKSVLSIAYVGTQNRHQSYNTEINLPAFSALATLQAENTSATYNAAVPYRGYKAIRMSRNEANGDYNGLQMSLRGSVLSSDLTYQLGYTYSKTNDATTNGSSAGDLGTVSNPYLGWKYDFGPSPYDHRQIFFANFVYDIPFMKHSDNKLAKTLIGGWEVSGIISVNSGAPMNIGLNGQNVCSIVPNCTNRPDRSGKGHDPHTIAEWFDTSIYSTPAPGQWGNTPKDSVYGPGRHNWNLSLFKNFVFSETRGSNLQLRGEFFNVWNHTQLRADAQNGGYGQNFNGGHFGEIQNTFDPRIIQLAAKLTF